MRGRKVLLTIALLTLATFCLVGTVIAAKILLYKEPGFSGDWDNGTGESPSCAYGEYDEDSDKCVYEGASCAYGEYDEGTGKCKMHRYWAGGYGHWNQARNHCLGMGAHLITIMSGEENQEAAGLHDYNCWIDLYSNNGHGYWDPATDSWYDTGEPLVYTHWGSGNPYYPCGVLWNSGGWGTELENENHPYICEWDWESGATGLCPEAYTYQREGSDGYCYGDPECPEGYEYDQDSGSCIGDPQ